MVMLVTDTHVFARWIQTLVTDERNNENECIKKKSLRIRKWVRLLSHARSYAYLEDFHQS